MAKENKGKKKILLNRVGIKNIELTRENKELKEELKKNRINLAKFKQELNEIQQHVRSMGYKLNRCWLCGIEQDLTKHHIKPLIRFGSNAYKIPLCRFCHKEIETIKNCIFHFSRKKITQKNLEIILSTLKYAELSL